MKKTLPLFCSVQEVADLLGVTCSYVYYLIAHGRIPHIQQKKLARILIPREYVDNLVAEAYKAVTYEE